MERVTFRLRCITFFKIALKPINACGKDERASLLNLLFSPYKVSQEQAEEFVESAKKEI